MHTHSVKCNKCKYFKRYYIKGVKEFKRTDYGWCGKNMTVIDLRDNSRVGCEKFIANTERALNKRSVYYYLSELLTELSAIREVLQDEEKHIVLFCFRLCFFGGKLFGGEYLFV